MNHKWTKHGKCQNCNLFMTKTYDRFKYRWIVSYFDAEGKELRKRPECIAPDNGQVALFDLPPPIELPKKQRGSRDKEYAFHYIDMDGNYRADGRLMDSSLERLKSKFRMLYWRCTLKKVYLNGKLIFEV